MLRTVHAGDLRTLIVGGVAGLLALGAGVIVFGRTLRAQLSSSSRSRGRKQDSGRWTAADANVTVMPTGLARTLTARGAVTAQQLAQMSPAEREFFVSTVAAKLGEGSKPRLVGARGTPAGSPAVATAPGRSPMTDAQPPIDPLSAPALVSGPIHCPVCRTPIGQRTETPLLMSRCPGCGRRVGVRVEGDRLTVTVSYSSRTPALGITPIQSS